MVGVSSSLRFGLAFCEASGPRLVRRTGNDPELVELATRNAQAIAAGHFGRDQRNGRTTRRFQVYVLPWQGFARRA
jgi:Adenosine specific kinase